MAFYRIVAADSRSPRDGRFIEQLGYYDPLRDPPDINVDTEKIVGWFQKGAQPSDTVRSLLSRVGIMEMWHEFRKGRPLVELAHIEDEARKRLEAQAAMDRRKKEEKKQKKAQPEQEEAPEKEAQAAPAEEPEAVEAVEETADATVPVEEKPEPSGEEPAAEKADEGGAEPPQTVEQSQDEGSSGGGEAKPE